MAQAESSTFCGFHTITLYPIWYLSYLSSTLIQNL